MSGLAKPVSKPRPVHQEVQLHPLENTASGSLLAEIRRDVNLFNERRKESEQRGQRKERQVLVLTASCESLIVCL